MNYHVIPLNDVLEHYEHEWCPCHPSVERYENGNAVIIHNSYDLREVIESVNDILNNNNERER